MRLSLPLACLALIVGPAYAQTTATTPAPVPAKPVSPTAAAPARPAAPPAPAGQAPSPERLFADWDKDKNKQLSLEEFSAGLEAARVADMMARLGQQFRAADRDKSGFLEASEYAALPVIKRSGGGAPPFDTFDADKNKRLDVQEYLAMVDAMIRRNSGAK